MQSKSLHKLPSAAGLFLILASCTAARAITIFKVAATEENEAYPMVSEDTVVWQVFNSRYGSWDIEGAQVSDSGVLPSFVIADFSGDDVFPVIDGNDVVWQDGSNGTWDIRGYNLVTHQEFIVTNTKMSNQVNPAVYVDAQAGRAIIVWQDDRDGNWDIYGAIVDGPEVITTTEPWDKAAAIGRAGSEH